MTDRPIPPPSYLPHVKLPDSNDIVETRINKITRMREEGVNPYKNGLTPTHITGDIVKKYGEATKETLEAEKVHVTIAGRLMFLRDFGKAAFIKVQDRAGQLQVYVSKDGLGDNAYRQYKDFTDIGDFVFVEGHLFRTKTNELSIHATKLVPLTKTLRPLPEKFHGLTDIETRYRHRTLDLIVTEESRKRFRDRSRIVQLIRRFFDAKDFMEVETPMLHPIAGGAAARPFHTHHNTLDMALTLRIAPELYLKRLVAGGFDRVYEINRNFRNEGVSIKHNPEFTMMEFYWAYATYHDLMDMTEELFQHLAKELFGSFKFNYQGSEIDFSGPWKRLPVKAAVAEYSGFKDTARMNDRGALLDYIGKHKIPHDPKAVTGALLMAIFDAEVEAKLMNPTFITEYPTDVSFLSRANDNDPSIVDRFELYVYGREMANAFSELNDPLDQRYRFQLQSEAKARGDVEACDIDEDFLRALEHGLPPTAGEGIGIDRLVMLLTDAPSIRDVIFFPLMRKSD
jgi:lysyl-tRNA synthetase class 2